MPGRDGNAAGCASMIGRALVAAAEAKLCVCRIAPKEDVDGR
jgi:hypothetical protein